MSGWVGEVASNTFIYTWKGRREEGEGGRRKTVAQLELHKFKHSHSEMV